MRTSCDQYKTVEGNIINVFDLDSLPDGAILWNGYDYDNQYWVYNGSRDIRSVEELLKSE